MVETNKHLLFVEDEPDLRAATEERLADHGFQVVAVGTGEEALERLADFAFDVLIVDMRLPGIDGAAVLEAALERYPDIIGIVVTGFASVKTAVAAIKRGAADYITKPFQFDELLHVLESALEQRQLRSENAYLRAQLQERYSFEGIVGRSRPMRALFQLLETVAVSGSTILISGETGTGKELVARAVHHNSPRRDRRFVAINCSAIPETLLEAELFGHVRGAFTGAVGARQGRIEQAHRGTLFLDEVGTMNLAMQTKLLRVLQEREFDRIGDSHPTKVDVRVIAATNSNLPDMVAAGTFRDDLFYRLNVIPVRLPALRERREDVPLLAQHFAKRVCADLVPARAPVTISQDAVRQLMAYDWPGNVRQLENTIERAITLAPGRSQIESADLPPEVQAVTVTDATTRFELPQDGMDLDRHVADIELALIRQALDRTANNKRQAALLLNLKRTTLIEKLKRLERQ